MQEVGCLSIMWIQEFELKIVKLGGKSFFLLSNLTVPMVVVS